MPVMVPVNVGPSVEKRPEGIPGQAVEGRILPEPLPTVYTALDQFGLKLESAKAPVEVLVIDSVQKPAEN